MTVWLGLGMVRMGVEGGGEGRQEGISERREEGRDDRGR